MKLKRIVAYALCLFMLFSLLTACNREDGEDETETLSAVLSGGASTSDETEDITGTELQEALEVIKNDTTDYKDMTFHIYARTDLKNSFKVDELTDEPLDNSVFERNSMFMEYYGIPVELTTMEGVEFNTRYKADSKTDKTYDFLFGYTNYNMTFATEGYLYNFLDLDIDYNKPWWDKGTLSFNIADSVWFMNGSFNYDDEGTTYCFMFNKDVANEYFGSKTLFYDDVQNNKWTLDTFYNYARQASKENGDSVWDEKDQYGFVTTWEYGVTFYYGSGLKFIECKKGEDPTIVLDDNGIKKATDLLEKLNTVYGKEVTFWSPGGQEVIGTGIFWSGRCLFVGDIVSSIIAANKNMEDDFGVLPVPKYDEKQEEFHTWTHGISSSMLISDHIEDAEKFASLLEGFNVLSHKYVRDAYYNIVLTRKAVQDADSAPMLDIIFAGRVYDFAMYSGDETGLTDCFKTCVNSGTTNFASKYGSVKGKANSYLRNLVKKFKKFK